MAMIDAEGGFSLRPKKPHIEPLPIVKATGTADGGPRGTEAPTFSTPGQRVDSYINHTAPKLQEDGTYRVPEAPTFHSVGAADQRTAHFTEAMRLNPGMAARLKALQSGERDDDFEAANLIPGLRDELADKRDARNREALAAYRASTPGVDMGDANALIQMQRGWTGVNGDNGPASTSDPRVALSAAPSAPPAIPQQPLSPWGGQPGIQMPGQIFDDPSTKLLEDLIKGQIGQLTQPINDPSRAQYQQTLQQQLDAMRAPRTGRGIPQVGQPLPVERLQVRDGGDLNYTGGSSDFDETTGLYRSTGTPYPPQGGRGGGEDRMYAGGSRTFDESAMPGTTSEDQFRSIVQQQIQHYSRPDAAPHEQQYAQQLQQQLGRLNTPEALDPRIQQFQQLLQAQIGELGQPVKDPTQDQYRQTLEEQIKRFQAPIQDAGQDRYRGLLESQLTGLEKPSADEDALSRFLRSQFAELSQTPGYSNDERAILNTQALEPIEALRKASRDRELARTGQAGYLPTSGLSNARMTDADRYYDQLRTVTNRDLAVGAIDRRDADLNRAGMVGRDLLSVPREREGLARQVGGSLADLTSSMRREGDARNLTATGLSGDLAQFGQTTQDRADARRRDQLGVSGELAGLGAAERARRDSRQGQALDVSGMLAQLGQGQQQRADQYRTNALGLSRSLTDFDDAREDRRFGQLGQQSGIAGMLAALSQGTRQEEQGRQDKSIQLASILQQLPAQAQNQAMAVINGTAPPESLLPMITSLLNNSNQQNTNFYGLLGSLASMFGND